MKGNRVYVICRAALRGLSAVFFPIRADGLDNVPAQGPVLLCANHQSLSDPVAMCCALDRPVRFMAKKELFSVFGLRRLFLALGAFPVDRGAGDLAAVRSALNILKEGNVMGIFPQGSRTWKGLKPFQGGAALLALRSGATVIPVYIEERARVFRPIRIHFGPAVDLSAFQGKLSGETLQQATGRLQEAVYGLGKAGGGELSV